jgi:glucose-6-phosphate 1-epimerase
LQEDGSVALALALKANIATRVLFADFDLHFRVTIGAELRMELEVHNAGSEVFTFEVALHTYFAVGDVREAMVTGLADTEFLDKTDEFRRKRSGDGQMRITKETDQVHVNTQAACTIEDPVWARRIVIEKTRSESTVAWNPWIEKTLAMADLAPESWRDMLCVESGNIGENAVTLGPGESHTMGVTIRVEH